MKPRPTQLIYPSDWIQTYIPNKWFYVAQFLDALKKLRKAIISFVMSVRLSVRVHGTTGLPLDGFSLNMIFEDFSKIYRENSSFIKIGQE
jgi:hypothetical protein